MTPQLQPAGLLCHFTDPADFAQLLLLLAACEQEITLQTCSCISVCNASVSQAIDITLVNLTSLSHAVMACTSSK